MFYLLRDWNFPEPRISKTSVPSIHMHLVIKVRIWSGKFCFAILGTLERFRDFVTCS